MILVVYCLIILSYGFDKYYMTTCTCRGNPCFLVLILLFQFSAVFSESQFSIHQVMVWRMKDYVKTGVSDPTIQDKTRGILTKFLSGVIEQVRTQTGPDMLSVAKNHGTYNTLLHNIPLQDGVSDVCSAIKEHAMSRKRKRTRKPSGDSGTGSSITTELASESETKTHNNHTEECESSEHSSSNGQFVASSIKLLPYKPPDKIRTSSRRPKRESAKKPDKSSDSKPADSKKQQTNPKKKRKMPRWEFHKKCDRKFIKLADVMTTDVPILLDSEDDLDSLIKSKCPHNWTVGKPRTPVFKKKKFCSSCVLGGKLS